MRSVIKATYALFFFRPHTDMDRKVEIAYGIFAWVNLIVLVYSLINIFYE